MLAVKSTRKSALFFVCCAAALVGALILAVRRSLVNSICLLPASVFDDAKLPLRGPNDSRSSAMSSRPTTSATYRQPEQDDKSAPQSFMTSGNTNPNDKTQTTTLLIKRSFLPRLISLNGVPPFSFLTGTLLLPFSAIVSLRIEQARNFPRKQPLYAQSGAHSAMRTLDTGTCVMSRACNIGKKLNPANRASTKVLLL